MDHLGSSGPALQFDSINVLSVEHGSALCVGWNAGERKWSRALLRQQDDQILYLAMFLNTINYRRGTMRDVP